MRFCIRTLLMSERSVAVYFFLKSRCNFGDQVSLAETSSMSQAPRYMKEIPARFLHAFRNQAVCFNF